MDTIAISTDDLLALRSTILVDITYQRVVILEEHSE